MGGEVHSAPCSSWSFSPASPAVGDTLEEGAMPPLGPTSGVLTSLLSAGTPWLVAIWTSPWLLYLGPLSSQGFRPCPQ